MKLSTACAFAALFSSAVFAQEPSQTYTRPAPSAAAQPAPPSSGQTVDIGAIFDRLNTSHTGKLTKEEAQAQPTVAANFDAADTNHDGVLTKDEFLAAFKPQQ
jgi:EF hand